AGQATSVGAEADVLDRPTGVALERVDLLPGPRVPYLYRRIVGGGGQALAVGADAHAPPRSFEGEDFPPGLRVPHLHLSLPQSSAAGQARAVGAEAYAVDLARGALDDPCLLLNLRVPHLHLPLDGGAGEQAAVGAEADGLDGPRMALEAAFLTRL